jgi:hypothetical protein
MPSPLQVAPQWDNHVHSIAQQLQVGVRSFDLDVSMVVDDPKVDASGNVYTTSSSGFYPRFSHCTPELEGVCKVRMSCDISKSRFQVMNRGNLSIRICE